MDRAAERQRGARGELHGAAVQDRQRPGQPEADGTERGVRLGAEPRAAAAEDLGGGQQLRVDLEADDRLKRWHGEPIVPRVRQQPVGAAEIGTRAELVRATRRDVRGRPSDLDERRQICTTRVKRGDDRGIELRAGAALELEQRLGRA